MLDTQIIIKFYNLDVEAVIEVSVLVFNNMLVLVLVLAIVLICSTLLKRKILKKTVIRATKLTQIKR